MADSDTQINQEDLDRIATISQPFYSEYTINPCQSIPPRHPSPYRASDGHTYCTRCGTDMTEEGSA